MNRSTGTWQWNFNKFQSVSTIDRIPVVSSWMLRHCCKKLPMIKPSKKFSYKRLVSDVHGSHHGAVFGGCFWWSFRWHRLKSQGVFAQIAITCQFYISTMTCGFSISDLCQSMANPCQRYLMLSDIDRCVSIAGQTSVTVISDADALILFRNPTSHPTTSSNRLRDYTARFFHVCFHGFYLFLPKVMFISNRFICFGAPLIQLHVMNHHSWNSDGWRFRSQLLLHKLPGLWWHRSCSSVHEKHSWEVWCFCSRRNSEFKVHVWPVLVWWYIKLW